MVKLSNIKQTFTEDNEAMKVIKAIFWIAGIIAAIILFYVNDTSAKYVSKDIYETEKKAIAQSLEEFKIRIVEDNRVLNVKVDAITTSVNTLTIAVNTQIAQQELRRVRDEVDQLRQHQPSK